jgi:hypothetical protein
MSSPTYPDYVITVVHIKQCKNAQYIGRPSVLCNPYPIKPGQTRRTVIDRFEKLFGVMIDIADPKFMAELRRLHMIGSRTGHLELGCFCRPLYECHGDVIKAFLDKNRCIFDVE